MMIWKYRRSSTQWLQAWSGSFGRDCRRAGILDPYYKGAGQSWSLWKSRPTSRAYS